MCVFAHVYVYVCVSVSRDLFHKLSRTNARMHDEQEKEHLKEHSVGIRSITHVQLAKSSRETRRQF